MALACALYPHLKGMAQMRWGSGTSLHLLMVDRPGKRIWSSYRGERKKKKKKKNEPVFYFKGCLECSFMVSPLPSPPHSDNPQAEGQYRRMRNMRLCCQLLEPKYLSKKSPASILWAFKEHLAPSTWKYAVGWRRFKEVERTLTTTFGGKK